jgi:hypothetical protein
MALRPVEVQLSKAIRRNRRHHRARLLDVLEGVIRRSTYVLLALGGLAASLKLLRDVIAALFAK